METKIRTIGVLHAKSFSVNLDEVDYGEDKITRKLAVRHPSAVTVIALTGPDEALVVTQHRYAADRVTVEFPAGKIDPGETPDQTAARELMEETGYRASKFRKLASIAPAPGYSDEIIHVFLAEDLSLDENRPDDAEIERVDRVTLSKLKEMILSGEVMDSTTIAALASLEWSSGATF